MRGRFATDQRNCASYALDIDGRIKRHAFLQVGNFRKMARTACTSCGRAGAVLCQAVRTEVVRMAELKTPFGVIRLMRKTRPPARPTKQYRQLRIQPRYHRVALLVAPDRRSKGVRADFHFIREVGPARWLHKPGRHRVTNKDSDGRLITSPLTAARLGRIRSGKAGPMYRFCAYMWVVSRITRALIARRLALRTDDAIVTALDRNTKRG